MMPTGPRVIVLGGAGGDLGRRVAARLQSEYWVVGVSRHRQDSPAHEFHCADLADHHAVTIVAQDMLAKHGACYGVINCAGSVSNAPLWKMTPTQWHDMLHGHLTSSFNLISAFAPAMREAGNGRFIFLSSVVAQGGAFGASHYAAAKGGVEALTRSAALELGPRGITVNCIAPGYMDSGVIRDVPEKNLPAIIERIPLGKLGPSEEVAHLAHYLLSDAASYVTSQIVGLDGGYRG